MRAKYRPQQNGRSSERLVSECLSRCCVVELLNYTLPPAVGDLKLDEGSRSRCGNDLAPKFLCSVVGWHLAYFPRARVTLKDMQRQGATGPSATVPLKNKELLHP